jgi:hypothetical protein
MFHLSLLLTQVLQVGWIVSGLFTVAATITSFWLIGKHLRWYTNVRHTALDVCHLLTQAVYRKGNSDVCTVMMSSLHTISLP